MVKDELINTFEEKQLDAIISEDFQTRLWYADVMTTDGYLIIEKNNAYLFVDSRYIEYAKNNAKNVEVILLKKDVLADFLANKNYQRIGYLANYLTDEILTRIKGFSPNSEFLAIDGKTLRIKKSEQEIAKIQKAVDISLEAYEKVKPFLTIGITEKEIAAKMNYIMKRLGADKESFDEIIAFGPSSAEPHHHPTDRKLENGDIIKMDFGAWYQGYSADITRTFIHEIDVESPHNPQDPKLAEILEIVKTAAKMGRDAVKPGILSSEIDKICRDYISSQGYGSFFAHSTGHGLGIDVHEQPNVSSNTNNSFVLKPGMVITVEPGIYIPGLGGARIEDDVLVTETGRRVLSRPEEN